MTGSKVMDFVSSLGPRQLTDRLPSLPGIVRIGEPTPHSPAQTNSSLELPRIQASKISPIKNTAIVTQSSSSSDPGVWLGPDSQDPRQSSQPFPPKTQESQASCSASQRSQVPRILIPSSRIHDTKYPAPLPLFF